MVSEKVIIANPTGLHVRPAGEFAKQAKQCAAEVTIVFKGGRYNGKSPINIMMAGIKCGDEIEIECTGEDEQRALAMLLEAVQGGLGERIS